MSLRATILPLFVALAFLPRGKLVASGPSETSWSFVDVARQSGLKAPTWCGRKDKPHILEQDGTGLALVDYDGDGLLDLYLVNGWRLDGSEVVERGRNILYRNQGEGRFEDVTDRAGVGDDGWGSGVAVGDLGGDGTPDLFVTNFGPDVLYLNNGDGTFSVLEDGPGIDGWSTGAVFFDADGDGDLDLFVAAQIESTLEEVLHAQHSLDWNGIKVMLGPFGLEGKANRFFENLGSLGFRDATEKAGFQDVGLYYSFAVAAVDLNGDRQLDLYITNDSNPNYMYRNQGQGRFKEVGLWSGAATDEAGMAQAGMGLAVADVNNDGAVDLFVTNFSQDTSTLYVNLGDFLFEDVTQSFGLRQATYQPLSWGTVLADLDLDGDLDLFVANGHIYPQADLVPGFSYAQVNLLLAGDGSRFLDVGAEAGPGLQVVESSRGLAAGDVDGDGDLDLAITNVDAPPTLLRNDSTAIGSWLLVDAPEALRVIAEVEDRRWMRHRVVGGSYLSVNDPRFHFGLGPTVKLERLTVEWLDGGATVLEDIHTNRVVLLRRTAGSVD